MLTVLKSIAMLVSLKNRFCYTPDCFLRGAVNRKKRPKIYCLAKTLMRRLMQIPVKIGVGCISIKVGNFFGSQQLDLIGRAKLLKSRLGHNQFGRHIRLTDGELKLDQTIGQGAHDANELARDVESAGCHAVSLLFPAPPAGNAPMSHIKSFAKMLVNGRFGK
jgi:hypothetical protein